MSSIEERVAQLSQKYPLSQRVRGKEVAGTETPGFSSIYRNAALPENSPLLESIDPELKTLKDYFANAVKHFGDQSCLGVRKFHNTQKNKFDDFYTFETFNDINVRKNCIASGIIYLVTHHPNYKNDFRATSGKPEFTVSILSPNSKEWILIDIATRDYSLPNTALYPTLGLDSFKYILEVTESPILFLTKDQFPKVLQLREEGGAQGLNVLVSLEPFDHHDHDLFTRADKFGIQVVDFRAVEKTGKRNLLPVEFNPPKPETTYTFSFTSGTTGKPKGVLVTHKQAVAGVTSGFLHLPKPVSHYNATTYNDFFNNKDDAGEQIRALSSLPLAHIYERQLSHFELFSGYALGMLSRPKDPTTLFDDIKALKPHTLASVPRIYNKVESIIKDLIKTRLGKDIRSLKDHEGPEADKQVLRDALRKQFGLDNARYLVCGSAPLSGDTISYLKDKLNVGVMVAYGSTESFAGMMFGDAFEEVTTNSSGPTSLTTEIKLRDVSEMGYGINDKPFRRGELMLRGPQIFKEYYRNEKATKETFTEDGWFLTGDIAAIDQHGGVYIIDRLKNFFKLSQGEYVTPEKIENIYLANSPLLTQLFIHGDSLQNYLVAIAGVNVANLVELINKYQDHHNHKINASDLTKNPRHILDLVKSDPKLKKIILQELNRGVKHANLQGFEKLHNLHLDIEPLKIEDEVLTPTLKLKRANAKKKFAGVIKNLYEEGSLVKNEKL